MLVPPFLVTCVFLLLSILAVLPVAQAVARRAVSAGVSPSVGVGAGAFVCSVCVLEAPVAAAAAVGVATTGVCLYECRSLVLCVRIERGEGTENTCGCHKGCKDEVFTFHDSVPCSCRAQLLMIVVVSLTVYETTTHEVTCRVPFFSKKSPFLFRFSTCRMLP